MNYIKLKQINEDAKLINFFFSGQLTKDYEIKVDSKKFEVDKLNIALNQLYENSKLRQQWQATKDGKFIIINQLDINKNLKKQACFEFLKEKLDIFINEFEMLKQVEIGNIQEKNSPYEKEINIIPEIIKRDRGFEDYLAHKIRQEKRKGKFTNDK
jgi:hypothetical protein